VTTPAQHPARYNARLITEFAAIIHQHSRGWQNVLDPMAGTGEALADLQARITGQCYGIELEESFIVVKDIVEKGNACELPWSNDTFDWIVVSPTYGNGMNDPFLSSEGSARHTYVHRARAIRGEAAYVLPIDNTGRYHFDTMEYRVLHEQAWKQAHRVLKPRGHFILNTKNAVSRQRRETCYCVTAWHVGLLIEIGFEVIQRRQVPLPGLRHGSNPDRVGWEDVTVLRKVG